MNKVRRMAIIADGFEESSICLAKYIAQLNVQVDYFYFSGLTRQSTTGFDYQKVNQFFLYHKLINYKDIPEIRDYCKGLPISFHFFRNSIIYKKIPFLYNYTLKKIGEVIKNGSYDVINLVGSERMAIMHNMLRGLPIVHSIHEVGSHQDGIPSSNLINLIIKDKTPVLFFSESTRNRFLTIEGAEHCLSIVIPFGKFETILLYDRGLKIETHLDLNKVTFLYFGFIKPYKGLDILAESMRLLESFNTKFNVIIAGAGSDPNLSYFRSQSNCFVLNKMLSTQELIAINKISDVVVLPYKSASQTGIIPTVFLFGTPVIATKVGALPDVVRHNMNGLMVNKNKPEEFAEAMKKLIEDPSLISRLSEGTKCFGKGDIYDWQIIAKKTMDFFGIIHNNRLISPT